MAVDELKGEYGSDEVAEDLIVDLLTGNEIKRTDREEILQRTVRILAGEYHFPLESIARDVRVNVEISGRRKKQVADLVVYELSGASDEGTVTRIVSVQSPSTKPTDPKRGIALLEMMLDWTDSCEFGLWTNGRDVVYLRKVVTPIQNTFVELSDFPGQGETLDELERPDRRISRVAVAEDLRETILRCHDYLYGNQAMAANLAFSEIIKLIFCKIYDERQLRDGTWSRRRFWVGVTERNTPEGQERISKRIKELFESVKSDPTMQDVFRKVDEIELTPKHLAWIASELARYQFLDADVDVKGMAYEAMVATTMKRERGQFFTPRNVVQAMVEMLAPRPGERVLDPACGSARFLVACLDRYRQSLALAEGPADEETLRRRRNSARTLTVAGDYAQQCLFGIDVDHELQRAAKMNMLMNNDGRGNLFSTNSLEVSPKSLAARSFEGAECLALESFDVVLTNPPFGTKIPVDDPVVLANFDLAHRWYQAPNGEWVMDGQALRPKMPPEILFIERCMQWLKPGGRMGIVLPDGILGNPDNEPIRAWILRHARVLASIDLPVETFLPQVGVQSSLLFLQKKTQQEVNAGADPNYPIFMAIAEFVGHDRRGTSVYRRDPDGFDVYEPYEVDLPVVRDGHEVVERRVLRRKQVADDLPAIADAYLRWRESGEEPTLV